MTLYALRFTNIPDAGTRHFDTMTEATLAGEQSGFEFTVTPVELPDWTITYDPPPIPIRDMDYCGVHEDYDGAPDANDNRCVRGASAQDVLEQIREMEE